MCKNLKLKNGGKKGYSHITKSTFGYKTKRAFEKKFYIYSKKVLNNSFSLYPDRSKVDSDVQHPQIHMKGIKKSNFKGMIVKENSPTLSYKIQTFQIQYLIRQS